MDGHDPLNPADLQAADLDADSVDSAGIDLTIEREQEDGTPTAAAIAEQQARGIRTESAPPKTETPQTGVEDAEDDTEAAARARDERGRFAKTESTPPAEPRKDRGTRRVETLQRRIDEATRNLRAIEARLEARTKELETTNGPADAKRPADKTPAEKALEALGPKPKWTEFEKQGKTYDEFEDAKDAWVRAAARAETLAELEQRESTAKAETEKQTAQQREADARKAFDKKLTDVRAKHQDFDQVIRAASDAGLDIHDFIDIAYRELEGGADLLYLLSKPEHHDAVDAIGDFFDRLGWQSDRPESMDITFPLLEALSTSENPARLLLACADPQTQKEIEQALRLPRRSAALAALVRFEERLAARASDGSPRRPAPGSTAAPPPSHVAGSRSAGVVRSSGNKEANGDDYFRARASGKSPAEALRSA
jgi:hypothetical protein